MPEHAARNFWGSLQRLLDLRGSFRREPRVGVQKQQHITRCLLRRRILLPSPPARRVDYPTRQFARNPESLIRTASIGDQYFKWCQRVSPLDSERDIRVLVKRRDDNGQSHR